MAGFVVDTIRRTVSEAVEVGRQVGGRAAATAGPRIVSTVEAVRSRLTGPHPKPPTAPTPRVEQPPPAKAPAAKASRPPAGPSPATVAKNVAKHDPASDPVIPKRKPAKKSVPGAKLPAPKNSAT
jgi:hypothetical protein